MGNEDDDYFRLTATVDDTAQLRWWLLSFGSKVEVLEPAGRREEMENNILTGRRYECIYLGA